MQQVIHTIAVIQIAVGGIGSVICLIALLIVKQRERKDESRKDDA